MSNGYGSIALGKASLQRHLSQDIKNGKVLIMQGNDELEKAQCVWKKCRAWLGRERE